MHSMEDSLFGKPAAQLRRSAPRSGTGDNLDDPARYRNSDDGGPDLTLRPAVQQQTVRAYCRAHREQGSPVPRIEDGLDTISQRGRGVDGVDCRPAPGRMSTVVENGRMATRTAPACNPTSTHDGGAAAGDASRTHARIGSNLPVTAMPTTAKSTTFEADCVERTCSKAERVPEREILSWLAHQQGHRFRRRYTSPIVTAPAGVCDLDDLVLLSGAREWTWNHTRKFTPYDQQYIDQILPARWNQRLRTTLLNWVDLTGPGGAAKGNFTTTNVSGR